jgi:hypothetical protein
MVSLIARSSCYLCGYQVKVVRISEVRVNKRSLKERGVSLVAVGARGAIGFPPLPHGRCPECLQPDDAELIPVSRYRLDPEDLEAVGAYRAKRWPSKIGALG